MRVAATGLVALLGTLGCGLLHLDENTGGTIQDSQLEHYSPDTVSGLPNAPLVDSVGVKILAANGGNVPRLGVVVTWEVLSGGGSVSSAATATDTAGYSAVRWTLGNEPLQ